MKLSIITPCYQAEERIVRTVSSVVDAARRAAQFVDVEYILVDGGSSDRSVERAKALISDDEIDGFQMHVISERDNGMYDALAKGLEIVSGDVHAYINAGDYYSPDAFLIIGELFAGLRGVEWVTGLQVEYNDRGHMMSARLPYRFRNGLIRRGWYDGLHLPFLQQESTFWRASLTAELDLSRLRGLRYAGDYYLWKTFAQFVEPMVIEAWLGGFAFHRGQISEDRSAYVTELKGLAEPRRLFDWFYVAADRFLWGLPRSLKWRLGRNWLVVFDRESEAYRRL